MQIFIQCPVCNVPAHCSAERIHTEDGKDYIECRNCLCIFEIPSRDIKEPAKLLYFDKSADNE